MKPFILAISLFSSVSAWSQNISDIEHQLLTTFQRIDYWRSSHYQMADKVDWEDSLAKADTIFRDALTSALNLYPSSLHYSFPILRDSGLAITTSSDGKFRIYNWDNEGGGSMRYIDHVFQYQVGNKVKATTLAGTSEDNEIGWSIMISPLRTAPTNYYLNFTRSTISGSGRVETARAFRIGKDSLSAPVELFNTNGHLEDQIGLEFMDFRLRITKTQKLHALIYDSTHQTIKIPSLDEIFGNPTGQYTRYRWSGKYFIAVAN